MGTYPLRPRANFVTWCRAHEEVFSAHAAEIGLSPAQAAAFALDTESAAAAVLAQEQAQQAALVATQAARSALAALRGRAGDTVRIIRTFAQSAPTPADVYNTAQIAPPAARSPAPPPARPSDLSAQLDATSGSVTLRWKVTNPAGTQGTTYLIRRRLSGAAEFAFLGVTGEKTFIDDTLLAGAASAQYTVQGMRGKSKGPVSAILTVNFGKHAEASQTSVSRAISDPNVTSDRAVVEAIARAGSAKRAKI